jgi:hypothetical protein
MAAILCSPPSMYGKCADGGCRSLGCRSIKKGRRPKPTPGIIQSYRCVVVLKLAYAAESSAILICFPSERISISSSAPFSS